MAPTAPPFAASTEEVSELPTLRDQPECDGIDADGSEQGMDVGMDVPPLRRIYHHDREGAPAAQPARSAAFEWVYPRVRVASRDELTCLKCGETYPPRLWAICPRCNDEKGHPAPTPTVPTISYLLPEEYELLVR